MNPLEIKAIAGLLLAIALFGGGWHLGAKNIKADWEAEKLQIATANQKAILSAVAKNEDEHKKDVESTKKELEDYETKLIARNKTIDDLRIAESSNGLRINRSVCDSAAATPKAASTSNADAKGSGTIELPKEIERGLFDLAESADKEIADKDAKIDALQQWIIDHGFYE